MSVVTDVIHQGGPSGKIGPILVQFEHGKLSDETSLDQFETQLSYTFKDDGKVRKCRPEINLGVQNQRMKYSNRANSVRNIRPNPYMSTFLAIKNKKTNQIRLVETNTITLGAMVKAPTTTNTQLLAKLDEEPTLASRLKKKQHLVQEFGQSKGQKSYEQADRMTIKDDVITTKLTQTAAEVDQSALVFDPEESNLASQLLPPCDRKAASAIDVYNLDIILSPAERESLAESAELYLAGFATVEEMEASVKKKDISILLCQLVSKQWNKPDYEYLGVALYVEGLIKLQAATLKTLKLGPKGLPQYLPEGLKRKIFKEFVEDNRLTPLGRDKTICYIIVLSLLINDLKLSFPWLNQSLKKAPDKIKHLISFVGATLLKSEDMGNPEHFTPDMFFTNREFSTRKRLKPDAVPTIFSFMSKNVTPRKPPMVRGQTFSHESEVMLTRATVSHDHSYSYKGESLYDGNDAVLGDYLDKLEESDEEDEDDGAVDEQLMSNQLQIGSVEEEELSLIQSGVIRAIINLMWLTLPVGLSVSTVLGLIWIYVLEEPSESYYTPYKWAIFLKVINLLFTLAAEPFHIIGQAYLHVKFRSMADMYWAICGPFCNILIVNLVPYHPTRLIAHGLIAILGTNIFLLMHIVYFHWVLTKQNREGTQHHPDSIPLDSIRDFLPDLANFSVDQERWKISWKLLQQGFLRQILMDGERYMFVCFHLMSLADQGIYGAVGNLAATSLKLFFVKMEESTHLYFSQTVSREALADETKECLPSKNLHTLLKFLILAGLVVVVFGTAYAHPLLQIYGGDLLTSGGMGTSILKFQMIYILLLGLNVTSESYVLNALGPRQLQRYSQVMTVVTVVYLGCVWIFSKQLGPVGFVVANYVNLGLRLVYNFHLITKRHQQSKAANPLTGILPTWGTTLALGLAWAICSLSETYVYNRQVTKDLLGHIAVGALGFFAVLAIISQRETSLIEAASEASLSTRPETTLAPTLPETHDVHES
eukprot:maker-scaffold18_size714446-snap-gene-1.16 protein:Tk08452 transcript:maker-scaffold18_size714446-snap-gene-1.16-mRNA-1 annotation:"protein rft1 homolog"